MYHKFRITITAIVVMMFCTLSSTMTLSYFTDTDSTTNSFTIGNASTALSIYGDDVGEQAFDASNYTLTPNMPDIPFYLQATNDGNIPVYQRFRIVIPTALADSITLNLPTTTDEYVVTNQSGTYYIVSTEALAVGETTAHWPTLAIHVGDITNIDTSQFTCSDNSNNNCVLGINVYSDAIQTAGFANATDAFVSLDNNN